MTIKKNNNYYITIMNITQGFLLAGCVVMLVLILKCQSIPYREGVFAGPGKTSWDKWDNYDKNYSDKREYWGQLDPEGGWQGNPYSPTNNPGGYGFGYATGDVGAPGVGGPYVPQPARLQPPGVDLANATEEELAYIYKTNLMS